MVVSICPRCRGPHPIEECPQVKAIEYDEQHRIKRVEFLTPGDYMPPLAGVPFPPSPDLPDIGGRPIVGDPVKSPYDITVTTDVTTMDKSAHLTWTAPAPDRK